MNSPSSVGEATESDTDSWASGQWLENGSAGSECLGVVRSLAESQALCALASRRVRTMSKAFFLHSWMQIDEAPAAPQASAAPQQQQSSPFPWRR